MRALLAWAVEQNIIDWGLKNRNGLSHSSGGWESEISETARLGPVRPSSWLADGTSGCVLTWQREASASSLVSLCTRPLIPCEDSTS